MFDKLAVRFAGLACAAVLAGTLLAPRAEAAPLTFYNNAGTQHTERFTIGCGSETGSCAGLLQAVTDTNPLAWSSTLGQMLVFPSSADPTTETNLVNGLLGTNLTASSGHIEPANKNHSQFAMGADYFLVKVGNGPTNQPYALLQNISGGSLLDLWFTATGQAGGLSHYITFDSGESGGDNGNGGTVTAVPEPGVLGMFGLGLLLAGLGYRLRRRDPA